MMRPPRPKAWSEWPVGWWLKIVVHSLFFSAFFRSLQFPPNLPLDEEEEGFFSSSLQRLPLLIKCKKKLSVLWPFLIACGMWKIDVDHFSNLRIFRKKDGGEEAVKGIGELSLLSRGVRRFFWRMPPIVCSRLFVWPSTIWPCTKCDRNIFSFHEKNLLRFTFFMP